MHRGKFETVHFEILFEAILGCSTIDIAASVGTNMNCSTVQGIVSYLTKLTFNDKTGH